MKKMFLALSLLLMLLVPQVQAAQSKQWTNWNEIADAMVMSLNQAYGAYFNNKAEAAKDWVNDAYFAYYEKEGFERAVMSYISGKRASTVEYQFALIKRMIGENQPNKEVRAALDALVKMLKEDANQLDGKEESALGIFLAALAIILREGFEAILVIAAITAYLARSGNLRQTRVVYLSALFAVVASVAAAIAMQYVFEISGANQEILEGAAMLLATLVLLFVSNWMFGKAESEAWKNYIEGKVQSAVQTGSAFALGAAAFLAVFREGAETILFYQAMLADVSSHGGMIWMGFGVGCLALVVIFIIARYGSLKLPLKPFFIATSVLMYFMAIAFAGGGIKELQEADVVGVTPVNFVGHIDVLGIYPTLETLLPQLFLLALVVASVIYYRSKGKHAARLRASENT